MKKIRSVFTLVLLAVVFFCTPVLAKKPDNVVMQYVFDSSDLLTYEEWEALESQAEALSERHQCGIYFAMVDDYTEYGEGSVFDLTYRFYHNNQLGIGENRDGIIVLLSMDERDYSMFVYGEYAEYAFNDYGQKILEKSFLKDFGKNDWQGGIFHYLNACDEYLTKAAEGKPVCRPYLPRIALAVGISCLIAGAVCLMFMRRMKTVHQKAEANEYLIAGGLHLTEQYDQFDRVDVIRTRMERESSDQSESGGGGSGRSGKF